MRRRPRKWCGAGIAALVILTTIPASAQYQVSRRVVASGGAGMGSAGYQVTGTAGQAATGPMAGATTSTRTGYWSALDLPTAIGETSDAPRTFSLEQNFPNPFNPATTIRFALPRDSFVRLRVFDVAGAFVAELVNERRPAGIYSELFDASSLSSGIYFYRIEADGFVRSRKLVLLK